MLNSSDMRAFCDKQITSRGAFDRKRKITGVDARTCSTGCHQETSAYKQAEAAGPRKPSERDGLSPPRQACAYQAELRRYEPTYQRYHFGGSRRLPEQTPLSGIYIR